MLSRLKRWRRWRQRPEHFSMTLGEWIGPFYEQVMERRSWMGTRALKNPLDAWIYQEIIAETKPDLILELGSAYGGGTLFLAHMLDLIGADGPVITVDHNHEVFSAEHSRIHKVTGDTRSDDTIEAVAELAAGKRGMVIHDANHDAHAVILDLRNYSRFVAPGCYLVVEDGIRDHWPYPGANPPGPLIAIRRFLAETDEFEVDADRERHLLTYNPEGFLRRRTAA